MRSTGVGEQPTGYVRRMPTNAFLVEQLNALLRLTQTEKLIAETRRLQASTNQIEGAPPERREVRRARSLARRHHPQS